MIKKIILLILILTNVTLSEKYIAKTKEEELILNDLKKVQLKFGLSEDKFYNKKYIDDKSINDIIKELLSDYLGLNITYEKLSCFNKYNLLKNSNLAGSAFMNRDYSRDKFIDFSQTIYNDNLYVVSTKTDVGTLRELNKKDIYYLKGSIYSTYLKSYLSNNDFKANLIEVEDLNLYKDKLILTENPVLYSPIYGVRIGYTSGVAFGINREYSKLIPILNNSLNEKYRKVIGEKIIDIRSKLALDNFYNSLTLEEKEYMKRLTTLKVSYESDSNSLASYYDDSKEKYVGVAPNILDILSQLLGIKFIDITPNNGDADIMVFSKTEEREEKFIFSNKIYETEVYLIDLKDNDEKYRTVGVIDNSVEKTLAEKYDIEQNIKLYKSYEELINALNTKEVENILIIKNDFDHSIYDITLFEKIPVNFAFRKNDKILKNIINKSFSTLVDDIYPIQKAILERENLELTKRNNDEKIKMFLISFSLFLLIGFLIIAVKLILDLKYKKELLKDPLSELPNRNVFNEFCEYESSLVSGFSFIIDMDNFKELNDKYGHNFGDLIIVELSKFLKLKFKNSYIFRISGDEFYGVFTEDYEKIIEKLNEIKIESVLFKKYNLTYSVGLHKKRVNDNIQVSFKYADMALFRAKKSKGISIVLADEKFIQEKNRELKILELLDGDLNELYAVYQPKIGISSNKVIGLESLVRCHSSDLGDIYPNELIPIAENFNLIHKIDYKVAEESVKFIKELMNLNILEDDFRISFNLSVKTFLRDDLVETIKKILETYDISGKYIEVEITETILVKDIKNILLKLGDLINLSIQISLDDFTAGHSTARLLPILPIDIIKFDKSLLDSLEDNEEKSKIVYSNLASLVKKLNLKIVSEGIETEKQLEFLKEINIDYGQGYLFSKPLKKKDYFKFIEKI